jgi:hypothetical protein
MDFHQVNTKLGEKCGEAYYCVDKIVFLNLFISVLWKGEWKERKKGK